MRGCKRRPFVIVDVLFYFSINIHPSIDIVYNKPSDFRDCFWYQKRTRNKNGRILEMETKNREICSMKWNFVAIWLINDFKFLYSGSVLFSILYLECSFFPSILYPLCVFFRDFMQNVHCKDSSWFDFCCSPFFSPHPQYTSSLPHLLYGTWISVVCFQQL